MIFCKTQCDVCVCIYTKITLKVIDQEGESSWSVRDMYNPRDMYWQGLRKALKAGPRMIIIQGKPLAVYALSRTELDELFDENHFQTATRKTWLTYIEQWPKYGATVPLDLKKNTGNWSVIFENIDKDHHRTLRKFAEDNGYIVYPTLAEGLKA